MSARQSSILHFSELLDHAITEMMRQENYIDALISNIEDQKNVIKTPHSSLRQREEPLVDFSEPISNPNLVAWRLYPVYDKHGKIDHFNTNVEDDSDLIDLDHLKKSTRQSEVKEAYKYTEAAKARKPAILVLYQKRLQRATVYKIKYDYNKQVKYGQYQLIVKFLCRANKITFDDARLKNWYIDS